MFQSSAQHLALYVERERGVLEDGSDGGSEGSRTHVRGPKRGGGETVIPVGVNLVIREPGCVQGRDGLESGGPDIKSKKLLLHSCALHQSRGFASGATLWCGCARSCAEQVARVGHDEQSPCAGQTSSMYPTMSATVACGRL